MKNYFILALVVLFGFFGVNAQTLLTCAQNPSGAKVSFISKSGQDIQLKVDWDENSTLSAVNLTLENATCTDCPYIGGMGRPHGTSKTWTIRQTDPNAPVSVAWVNDYCGSTAAVTIPATETTVLPINGTIVLRGDNTRYVSLLSDSKLAVNQNSKSDAVSITVISAGNGKVALQASNGKYVTIDASSVGRVSATKNSIGATEKFTVEELASGGFSIKASNGKYIQAAYSSGGVLLANSNSPKKFTYQ